jgi:hypothetical protein
MPKCPIEDKEHITTTEVKSLLRKEPMKERQRFCQDLRSPFGLRPGSQATDKSFDAIYSAILNIT